MKIGDLLVSRFIDIVLWSAVDPNNGEAQRVVGAGPFICCGTWPQPLNYITIILLPDGTLASAHTVELRLVR